MDLGQHFLVNQKIAEKVVDSLELKEKDVVLEIGGGRGVLSEKIARKVKKFYIIEIDKNLVDVLKNKFGSFNNVEIINEDFLKFDLDKLESNFKIVGNIPYSITSSILGKIFHSVNKWQICVLMLQKEVAKKLLAKPKDTFFSKLTLIANFYTKINFICDVYKEFFEPKPKVHSAVVKFLPNYEFLNFEYKNELFEIITVVFAHKRKTLLNSLHLGFKIDKNILEEVLVNSRVKISSRPQELSIGEYIKITEKLSKIIKKSTNNYTYPHTYPHGG